MTNAALSVSNALFESNVAGTTGGSGEGGAVFLSHPSLTTVTSAGYSSRAHEFTATRFSKNTAGWRGGSVAIADVSPLLTNCAFTDNRANGSAGQGGAVSVAWEVSVAGAPTVPSHPPTPKIIHATFARNQATTAANVFSQSASAPWLINSLFTDGWVTGSAVSLVGPRQLWGSQLAPPDALAYAGESDSVRRNLVDFTAATTPPVLAFDWFHLATPVRVPSDTSSTAGGVETSASVTFTRPTTDIDAEARPAAAASKFTLMRGCDEPRDAEVPADGLPDWFEKLGYDYSPYDALTGLNHIAPGGLNPELPTASPTNNPDADGYTITQELLNGGRPDLPESMVLGRDSDGDGLSDLYERLTAGLDWRDADMNDDGISDGWAIRYFGSLSFDLAADSDNDGLTNGYEASLGLNPQGYDSDGDGIPDAWELAAGTDPDKVDSNADGQPDGWGEFPADAQGNPPQGLHKPSAAAPWYVERAWSAFDFDPGLYLREMGAPNAGTWIEESMNSYSDRFLEPVLPIPFLAVPGFPFREMQNSMDFHAQYRPAAGVNRSLDIMTAHHLSLPKPLFYPLHFGFETPDDAVTALMSNRQANEAWASQWFDVIDGWVGDAPGSSHGIDLHNSGVMGKATQKWERHFDNNSISPEATRFIQSIRLRCPLPGGAPEDVSQNFLRIRGFAARVKQYTNNLPALSHPAAENNFSITPLTLTLAKGSNFGPTITLDPHQATPLASNRPTLPALPPANNNALQYFELAQFDSLLPVEVAPDVLAVNSDFDEGRANEVSGYAVPDCDDPGRFLAAERAHLDGRWATATKVTEDMHQGWFGVKPSQLGADFWNGSTVTIKKIDKIDPDTNRPESGEVRFYATDGVANASGYQCIEPYDLTTHVAVNLVTGGIYGAPGRSVYGTNTDISSSAKFWIEGVKPGKITLEWRYVKGSTDIKHEQTFKVLTKKTPPEWLSEVNYQIRLQTQAATGTAVDVSTYHPGDGFYANVPKVQAIYYYYRQLFRQMPEKFMWAGMAKTAAAPIYAGMSDLTEWYNGSELTPGTGFGARDVGTAWFINGLLLDGQRHIFNDMAWSHRAYQASGIGAIEHSMGGQVNLQTSLVAWRAIDTGILNNNQNLINTGNGNLLRREQQEVVQDDYVFIRGVYLRQPPAIAAWWFDATIVPVNASGLANAAVWLTANSKKNPLNPTFPHAPSFLTTVPGGHLDVFADRWAWTSNPTNGMLELWTGTSTGGPNFDAAKRLLHAGKSMYSAAAVYSYDTAMLPNE